MLGLGGILIGEKNEEKQIFGRAERNVRGPWATCFLGGVKEAIF